MRRKPGKIAAVCAVVTAVTLLAACSENNGTPAQNQQTQSAQTVQSAQSDTTTQSTNSTESTQSSQSPQNSQKQPEQSSSSESSPESSSAAPQSAPAEGFPENPSEASVKYFEDAVGIVDKYLSIVMGNKDDVERLGIWERYDEDENAARQEITEYLLDCAKKSESYLDELEKLAPTEEMSAFHSGLVNLMNVMREYSDIAKSLETLDVTDEAAEEEFMGRVDELFERFNAEYKAFYVKYPGFGNVLEDGEWQSNGASAAQYITPNLAEDARENAQKVLAHASYWVSLLNDKSVMSNAVLEMYSKKGQDQRVTEINGIDEKVLEGMPEELRDLQRFIDLPEGCWARIYFNAEGLPQYVMFSPDGKIDESELNGGAGFESNLLEWRLTGVTPGGHVVGMVGVPPTSEAQ